MNMVKAWFRLKWMDEFKMFFFQIETSHSESRYSITDNEAKQIIKALEDHKELVFEVS